MKRCALILAAAAVLLPAGTAEAAKCPKPAHMSFTRKPGAAAGRLSWQPAKHAPRGMRYRVWRDRAVVGQTRKSSIKVRVSVGHRYRFAVAPVKGTRPLGCRAQVRKAVNYLAPGSPADLAIEGTASPATVHLSWSPAKRGDAKIGGYRVLRSGATYKQVKPTGLDVPVANDRTYQFVVRAVDVHGHLSGASNAVTMDSGHLPPSVPLNVIASDLTDSELTLSWAPSRAARGTIAGYRIYRDGKPLRQVKGLATRVTNLAAASSHVFQVAAVDSSGWMSARSAPATVSTAPPVQSNGRAQAFLLASTDRSFADFRAHYTQIGVVYPTYFDCTSTGGFVDRHNDQITSWARARGVKVLPRMNCQWTNVLHSILNDPATRAQWLDRIDGLVLSQGYDGINIDFEDGAAADRSAFTSFVTELAQRLHSQGKLLSIAASPKTADVPNHPRSTFFDYPALAQQADWIFVMAWGVHWRVSAAGAQDDIAWLRQVVGYVDTVPFRGRFVLGMQLYGMDWPNGGGPSSPSTSYEYGDIMGLVSRYGGAPVRDGATDSMHYAYGDSNGVPHDVWFQDATTAHDRFQLAQDNGLGTGFWRLGNEDQRMWDDPLLSP